MEAGYDYLLINRRSRVLRRLLPLAGAILIVGALVGVLVWSLFAFVFDGSEETTGGVVATAQPISSPEQPAPAVTQTLPPAPTATAVAPPQPATPAPAPTPVPELPSDLARAGILYPGASVKAADWADLLGARGPITLIDEAPWSEVTPARVGQLPIPTRLILPSIDVDSEVQQLNIVDLGNSTAYETPNNVVGHIPTTANPGEAGSVWMFGHLESPIRDEGNVFAQLPEIPSKLRRGEEVFAVVQNGTESYRYRLVESRVVPQEQFTIDYLTITDDGTPQLFIVTAVPRGVYDQRLVVRGVLEGVRS